MLSNETAQNLQNVQINIVTYNNASCIVPCVLSALHQEGTHVSVHIWDNNSTDNTVALVERTLQNNARITNITVTKSTANIGFARAHNAMIAQSPADFILCLNSDAVLQKNYVAQALKNFSDPTVGAVQGKLLRYNFAVGKPVMRDDQHIIDTTGLVMKINRSAYNRGANQEDRGQFGKKEEVFGADGAAPFYRRGALEDAKISLDGKSEYFDEDFYIYKEDVDLSWRLRIFGWQTTYDPQCVGFHGRSAGDLMVGKKNIIADTKKLLAHRSAMSGLSKSYSFKNQRLMQIKNDYGPLMLLDIFPIALREFAGNAYALIYEQYFFSAWHDIIRLTPRMLRKRALIMRHKKSSIAAMAKWLNQ